MLKESFQGGLVSVVRHQQFFKTSSPPKPLGHFGPKLKAMFLLRSSLKIGHRIDSIKNSGCHGNEMVFINGDIVENIESGINLFADDTSLSLFIRDPNDAGQILQIDIEKINKWAETWLVKFSPSKSESLITTRKNAENTYPDLSMSNINIENVQSHKHLGFHLSNDGSWDLQIKNSIEKAWKRINIMRRLKIYLDRKSLEVIYFTFIRPIIEYGDVVWDNIPQYLKK